MNPYFLTIVSLVVFSILAVLYVRIFGKEKVGEEKDTGRSDVDNFTLLE